MTRQNISRQNTLECVFSSENEEGDENIDKVVEDNEWMYNSVMSKEVYMNDQNENEGGVNEEHVDCSDAFNTFQVLIWFIVIKVIKWMFVED